MNTSEDTDAHNTDRQHQVSMLMQSMIYGLMLMRLHMHYKHTYIYIDYVISRRYAASKSTPFPPRLKTFLNTFMLLLLNMRVRRWTSVDFHFPANTYHDKQPTSRSAMSYHQK